MNILSAFVVLASYVLLFWAAIIGDISASILFGVNLIVWCMTAMLRELIDEVKKLRG